jgi:molybdate transport system substrate-binding protein
MKKIFLLMLTLILFGTQSHLWSFETKKITIAAAYNLKYSLEKIKIEFEKSHDIKLNLVFGASGKLTHQIRQGAPFHIFLSADSEFPDKLYQEGLALDKPKLYAKGSLVLWFTQKQDFKKNGLKLLLSPAINKIAMANPKIAPYGKAAEQCLIFFGLREQVQPKIILVEGSTQVTNYIVSQSVDAGFSAKSIVLANELKHVGFWVELDPKSYAPLHQGAVILKSVNKNELPAVQLFYQFIFNKKSQAIFREFGFTI